MTILRNRSIVGELNSQPKASKHSKRHHVIDEDIIDNNGTTTHHDKYHKNQKRRKLTITTIDTDNPDPSSDNLEVPIVTPDAADSIVKTVDIIDNDDDKVVFTRNTRRSLILPSKTTTDPSSSNENQSSFPFGHNTIITPISPPIRHLYSLIRQTTGSIGGNGAGGAIYGELTVGSMQKVINIMKTDGGLNRDSRFIDVGCGLGKPNLHVAKDPGVAFSYGVEMERVRWLLGMPNLRVVLADDRAAASTTTTTRGGEKVERESSSSSCRCYFAHGDISEAQSFDPFTHVYMFDIGFPPKLFETLAEMFNESRSPSHLICYHGPRLIIETYGFDVALMTTTNTSMHGSSENHTCYFYRRRVRRKKTSRNDSRRSINVRCDSMFRNAWRLVQRGQQPLYDAVAHEVDVEVGSGRPKRRRVSPRCYSA